MEEPNQKPTDLIQGGTSLINIINWLKLGNTIVIYAGEYGRMYRMPGLEAIQKIYINVSAFPSLLMDEEWPWYILHAGAESLSNDDNIAYENTNSACFYI